MLRDVIPMLLPHPNRTHLAGGVCLSTSTICDWQAIGVRKYDPDGPARVRNLFIYRAGTRVCSVHLRPLRKRIITTCRAQVFKAGTSRDEEKEGSSWRIRLREQRTRIGWRQSSLPWATLAAPGELCFPAVYRLYMYIDGKNASQHGVCHIFFQSCALGY